jgi:hypothetical protein
MIYLTPFCFFSVPKDFRSIVSIIDDEGPVLRALEKKALCLQPPKPQVE